MAFEIHPVKEFVVSPALPPALSRLGELSMNLLWTWNHTVRAAFRRLDTAHWKACSYNPIAMLSQLPQSALDRAAADRVYMSVYRKACTAFDEYMNQKPENPGPSSMLVAYFSMEYGLIESLTIYSGGLGILSGDHLKGASDAGLNLVGVGLLYQTGYLEQHLSPDGWQTERYPGNDFYNWPVEPVRDESGKEIRIQVGLPRGTVHIKVWRMHVGRVSLLLLDTNIPENAAVPEYRDITDQLYGGDIHVRMRQEIVLGIGGLRALKTLGLHPTAYHMNEGHSAFLALERTSILMSEQGMSFDEALEATRSNNVFTTHTPVPAGIDMFDPGLVYEYFGDYCRDRNIAFDRFLALGRNGNSEQGDRFSMAVFALSMSSYRNAVSKLHAEISQAMFQNLWPNLPVREVPIMPITNGVHLPSWLNGDLAQLYDAYLQPDWRERYPERSVWEQIPEIPNNELWEAHRRRKRKLVAFVRERKLQRAEERRAPKAELKRIGELFDPDVLTIGFARRFATYKRAALIFRDPERLKRILTNPKMPVQIIIAGKAHPKDDPGKRLIQEIYQFTRNPEFARHITFIEDYDIQVGRELVQGVDLWLNNPQRGEEACGTSGMKAAVNGVLNFSILDGWFDEAFEGSGGWAIGDRSEYTEDQDDLHASYIYSGLESDIVPMYYQQREEGVPNAWMQRVKQSLINLSPQFNCQRMIHEYTSLLYNQAHENYATVRRDAYQAAREKTSWMGEVDRVWNGVDIKDATEETGPCLLTGQGVHLRAAASLNGLQPGDVRVEAVVGHVSSTGLLEEPMVVSLAPVQERDGVFFFEREFTPHQTGRLGYTLRIAPNHTEDPLSRPCRTPIKWAR
jgi:glycogen phosphorylase